MYTIVKPHLFSIKEISDWKDLLSELDEYASSYSFYQDDKSSGINYINIITYNDCDIYVIGLSKLEIDYIKLKYK